MKLHVLTAVTCCSLCLSATSWAQTFNARGTFNDWGQTALADDGDGTFSQSITGGTPGATVEFKIATNDWESSWPASNVKSVFNGTGEFTFHFAPGPFTDGWLPAANRVGYTDPGQFGWEIIGSFNGWTDGPELVSQGNGLYALDHTIETPGAYQFKFRRFRSWDFSIGEDFGSNAGNATFVTTETNQSLRFELDLPKGAWRVTGAAVPTIKAAVAFEANLNVQIGAGNFDTNTHQVWARGSALGWGDPPNGFQLFEDSSRPGIYTNTFRMESHTAGSNFEYKLTIWDTTSLQPRWEDGNNRVLVFDSNEPTDGSGYHLRTVNRYFNDQSPADILTQDTLVTFQVNMAGAMDKDGTAFNPGTDDLYINGNFANWYGWGGMPAEFQLVDNGTNGDTTAGDLIYTLQRLFPKGSSTQVIYKYGIFSLDNEAAAFNDRIRSIRALGTYVMPVDKFGDMTKEPDFGSLSVSRNGGNVVINWLGRPGVRLQRTTSLTSPVWQDVPNTDGGNSAQIAVPSSGAEFLRLIKP